MGLGIRENEGGGYTTSDGRVHASEGEAREHAGGGGGYSQNDMQAVAEFAQKYGPIILFVVACCGLFAPFRDMLADYYLIYISTVKFILCAIIGGVIIGLPLVLFVIFPILNGKPTVIKVLVTILSGLVALAGLLNGSLVLFAGLDPLNSNLNTRWRNSFYSFDYAKVNADRAVLRAAPSDDAKAVLTLERGEEFAIFGDAGDGWYFAREREINDDIRNYGYVRADNVTLDNPGAEMQTMRPAALLVDNASIHRARRWNSWQVSHADKDDYVLAAGRSRGGWTPVYTANAESWSAGYINDALLFFDDGTGATPPELKSVSDVPQWKRTIILFNYGNERYRYANGNGADKMNFMKNLPAERYTEVPPGGQLIRIGEQTKRTMGPVVYNGRMGWWGYLDWEKQIRAEDLPAE